MSTHLSGELLASRGTGWRGDRWRQHATYLGFVVLPLAVAVLVLRFGVPARDTGPVGAATAHRINAGPLDQVLYKLLLAVAVTIGLAHLCGALVARFGQPRVVGEMAAGFVLGPSVLGAVSPGVQHLVIARDIVPYLDVIAQVGVVLFMFIVGMELPLSVLREVRGKAFVVGHAGIAVPFLLSVLLTLVMPAGFRPAGVPPVVFTLFIGVAMSITAFPVLARILTDRKLAGTPMGALGMATAGVGDVTAWCVLALVIAVARGGSPMLALRTVLLSAVFGTVMWWVVRPLLAALTGWSRRHDRARGGVMVVLLVVVLAAAMVTDRIGVHAIFGAFLAGVVMPRDTDLIREFGYRIEGLTVWLMLPLFFVTIGLKTSLGDLGSAAGWLVLALVLVVAVAGKFTGTVLPARATGLDWRSAVGLGGMMNCRGLTEIVILNIGLTMGVIGPGLFTIMVVMALLTTAMTGPFLSRTLVRRPDRTRRPVPEEALT